jgi:hypothetical protein
MLKLISTIGANWKIWMIVFAIGALSGGAAGFKLGGVWQGWACTIEKNELVDLATDRIKGLENANDTIQKKYTDARSYRQSKRVQPQCLYSAGAGVLTAAPVQHAGGDGAITGTKEDFRDYAETCERLRQDRIVLESHRAMAEVSK